MLTHKIALLFSVHATGGVMDDNNFRKRVFQRAQRRAGLRALSGT